MSPLAPVVCVVWAKTTPFTYASPSTAESSVSWRASERLRNDASASAASGLRRDPRPLGPVDAGPVFGAGHERRTEAAASRATTRRRWCGHRPAASGRRLLRPSGRIKQEDRALPLHRSQAGTHLARLDLLLWIGAVNSNSHPTGIMASYPQVPVLPPFLTWTRYGTFRSTPWFLTRIL